MSLYVDITDLYHWDHTSMTGIQRAVVGLIGDLPEKQFVVFNGETNSFLKCSTNLSGCPIRCEVGEAVDFEKNDLLVFMGATWTDLPMLEAAKALKEKVGIVVSHYIHDIAPIMTPQYFPENHSKHTLSWFNEVVDLADHFVVNSQFTGSEIEKYLMINNIEPKEIKVVSLGTSLIDSEKAVAMDSLKGKDFVLCVGTLEPRKNHYSIYLAWKKLILAGEKPPLLVLAGKSGWLNEDLEYLLDRDPTVKDHIMCLGGVADDHLEWLYSHCLFTVFPSFYEGWGLPVSESLAHGKVCICSNKASMPEAGKDFADFIHPLDVAGIAHRVMHWTSNTEERTAMEEKISSQYHVPLWKERALDLNAVLQDHMGADS